MCTHTHTHSSLPCIYTQAHCVALCALIYAYMQPCVCSNGFMRTFRYTYFFSVCTRFCIYASVCSHIFAYMRLCFRIYASICVSMCVCVCILLCMNSTYVRFFFLSFHMKLWHTHLYPDTNTHSTANKSTALRIHNNSVYTRTNITYTLICTHLMHRYNAHTDTVGIIRLYA